MSQIIVDHPISVGAILLIESLDIIVFTRFETRAFLGPISPLCGFLGTFLHSSDSTRRMCRIGGRSQGPASDRPEVILVYAIRAPVQIYTEPTYVTVKSPNNQANNIRLYIISLLCIG